MSPTAASALELDPPAAPPRSAPAVPWRLLAFLAIAAVEVALCLTHAPWRDETQALLIAREPLPRLFAQLRYEGHPALWYLVLAAASKLSASPLVLPLVQATVAVATQAILWRHSPFSRRVTLLIALCYFLTFEYGVIARNYGLGVLLFFAFIAFRRSRWAWVLLALMCNTAVHTALLAGIGALILVLVERRWSWSGAALFVMAGLLAVATIIPAPDVYPGPRMGADLHDSLAGAIQAMSADILPALPGQFPIHWERFPPDPIDRILGAIVPFLGVFVLRRDRLIAGLYLLFCLVLLVLAAMIYQVHMRHAGLIVVLLIGLLWIVKERSGADPDPVAIAWLCSLAAGGVWYAVCSTAEPFCLSHEVAQWIGARKVSTSRWAAYPGFLGLDVSGLEGRPTFNVQKQCWDTYQRWNNDYEQRLGPDELGRRLATFSAATGPGYLLTDGPVVVGPQVRVTLDARFVGAMLPQRLFIYRVEPARSDGGPAACGSMTPDGPAARCVAPRVVRCP